MTLTTKAFSPRHDPPLDYCSKPKRRKGHSALIPLIYNQQTGLFLLSAHLNQQKKTKPNLGQSIPGTVCEEAEMRSERRMCVR